MNVLLPNFEKRGGIIPVIAQDAVTREILMSAYVDLAGYLETLKTGNAVYYSTSRNKRWKKGEESGDVQVVVQVLIDCDGDALVYLVRQTGTGACHTKARTCFYRTVAGAMLCDAPNAGEKEQLPWTNTEVHPRLRSMGAPVPAPAAAGTAAT